MFLFQEREEEGGSDGEDEPGGVKSEQRGIN